LTEHTGLGKSVSVSLRNNGPEEEMVTDQLRRIVVGISAQIGRDGHEGMSDVSTYGIIPRFDETSRFESLCRYSEIQVSQSISESENEKRPALSRKRSDILNIRQ